MMARRGHLFVLSAPSGTGKSTLIDRAKREIPNIWHSVSATTRHPRPYEKEGTHYFFMDRDAFERKIKENAFLEWAEVHGEYYGTLTESVERHLDSGSDVIMDIDVQGTDQLCKNHPDAVLIFIMPPSLEALRSRLLGRRAENEEEIGRRLSIAEKEIACRNRYDYIIVNDDFESAFGELAGILLSRRTAQEN